MCSVRKREPVVPVAADRLVGADGRAQARRLAEGVLEPDQAGLGRGLVHQLLQLQHHVVEVVAGPLRPRQRLRAQGDGLVQHRQRLAQVPDARAQQPRDLREVAQEGLLDRQRADRGLQGRDALGDRVAQRLGVARDGAEGDRGVGEELGVVLGDRGDDPAPRPRARGRSARIGSSARSAPSKRASGSRTAASGTRSPGSARLPVRRRRCRSPRAPSGSTRASRCRRCSRRRRTRSAPRPGRSAASRPPGARSRRRRARSPGT